MLFKLDDPLITGREQLVICNKLRANPMRMCLDTGASFPVWVGSEQALIDNFKGAEKVDRKTVLGGFGGNGTLVDFWCIPEFVLTDGKDKVVYTPLYLVCSPNTYGFDMIMSYTMLKYAEMLYHPADANTGPYLRLDFTRTKIETTLKSAISANNYTLSKFNVLYNQTYTLDTLKSDLLMLIIICSKYGDPTEWFCKNFPHGAVDAAEVLNKVIEDTVTL